MGGIFSSEPDVDLKGALVGMKTVERHADAMQGLFDANLEITKIRDCITNKKSDGGPSNADGSVVAEVSLQVLPDVMPAEVMSVVKWIHKENLAGLWEDSDKDGSGVLEQGETEALIQRYLAKSVETIEKSVDASLDQSIEVTLNSLKANNSPDQLDVVRAQLEEQFTAMKPKMLAELQRIHTEMMEPTECAAIAKELLQKMDLDGDGKIVKAEFEETFIEMIADIMGLDKLRKKLDLATIMS